MHLRALGDAYAGMLARHHEIIFSSVDAEQGQVVGSEGDSVAAVLPTPLAAARAALAAQRSLAAEPWPDSPWRVRMAVHAGDVDVGPAGATGIALHHAARVRNVAHGGQVLVTEAARHAVAGALPSGVSLADLGLHDVRDVDAPVRLYQLTAADLPASFPPGPGASRRRIPRAPSSFVGREDEVDELAELLETDRLVTVVGPGGCGKTRLALAVAERSSAREVVFVELADVAESQRVPAAIAVAVGAADPSAVVHTVRERDMLLVLDNCEHVVEGVAPLVAELAASTSATVLATSREAIGGGAETRWTVPRLTREDAVRLFEARSPRAITASERESVHEICERLDRIPLGIELAAARLRSMPLSELGARLDDQLGVLTGGRRDVPRQQTLRAALDWSHELLDERERRVLRRLSVFGGGWELAAAEAVVEAEGVVDVLDSLVTKSLVEFDPISGRYRLLEPVRQYADERLRAASEADAVRHTHLDWVVRLVQDAGRRLYVDQRQAVADLDAEAANVDAALAWALDSDRLDRAARIVGALAFYWFTSRRVGTSSWVEGLVSRADALPAPDVARVLVGAGMVMCDHTHDERPVQWLERAAELYRDLEHPQEGAARFWLGRAYAVRGRLDEARCAFEEASALFEAADNVFGQGWARGWLGLLLRIEGDLDAAETVQREVVELGERRGVPHIVGAALAELGRVAHHRGDPQSAAALIGDAIGIFDQVGDRWQQAVHHAIRSMCRIDLADAASDLQLSLRLLEDLGSDPDTRITLVGVAGLLRQIDRRGDAAVLLGAAAWRASQWLHTPELVEIRDELWGDSTLEAQRAEGARLDLWSASRLAQRWMAELVAGRTGETQVS